jgi:hypothetical protein
MLEKYLILELKYSEGSCNGLGDESWIASLAVILLFQGPHDS